MSTSRYRPLLFIFQSLLIIFLFCFFSILPWNGSYNKNKRPFPSAKFTPFDFTCHPTRAHAQGQKIHSIHIGCHQRPCIRRVNPKIAPSGVQFRTKTNKYRFKIINTDSKFPLLYSARMTEKVIIGDYFINLIDILKYMGPGERQYIEGIHVVDAKHLMYVGITEISDTKAEIICLCLQTSNLRGPPHELNLAIQYFTSKFPGQKKKH